MFIVRNVVSCSCLMRLRMKARTNILKLKISILNKCMTKDQNLQINAARLSKSPLLRDFEKLPSE